MCIRDRRHRADGQHIRRSVKNGQKRAREELEHQKSDDHQSHGVQHAQLDGFDEPVLFLGAVVVGDDGHHAVVQPHNRHKDKALELEVNPENGSGRRGKGQQNLVHAKGHDRGDGRHDNGGYAHRVNAPDGAAIGPEAPELQGELVVFSEVQDTGEQHGHHLADDRRRRRASHAHFREAKEPEDHDRVQNQVDDGSSGLGAHGEQRLARGLKQAFKGNLPENTKGNHRADRQILGAVIHDFANVCLSLKEKTGKEKSEDNENQRAENSQKDPIVGGPVGLLKIFLAQAFGQQGIDPHACASGDGDHQVLYRESQRYGRQRVLADHGYKHAVHNVVERLNQH